MISNFNEKASSSADSQAELVNIQNSRELTSAEHKRLSQIKEFWNFYEGYHWEGIDDYGSPQVTFNYCNVFVNKFVSFEFGKGFTIKTNSTIEDEPVTVGDLKYDINKGEDSKEDPPVTREKTLKEFIEQVWEDNNKETFCEELGQTKSVTGDAWVRVSFEESDEQNDPFGEFPNGRIRVVVVPTHYVFSKYSDHDKDKLESVLIMYPISNDEDTPNIALIRKKSETKTILYKEMWTNETKKVYKGRRLISEEPNELGLIPFVHIKNFIVAGKTDGVSDLVNVIPLNIELNTKRSDVSEIIDYHSAPITLVYGAKLNNLEKGANKVWGGLPKDSKVENLEIRGDLGASARYIAELKTAMCEIASVPERALGGAENISNTSGVALQYINLPLTDRTRVKRNCTKLGLKQVNKLIIFIAMQRGLVVKPDSISMKDFINTEVCLPDTLPKDELIELQKIEAEFKMALESRKGALERLGRGDIENKINEIDKERQDNPEVFNTALQTLAYESKLNSGMTNGETSLERLRKETKGANSSSVEDTY